MKNQFARLTFVLLLAFTLNAAATVRYVDLDGTNATSPFIDWNTAATNIQDAIDAAVAGDHILVTNGVYQTGGRAVFGLMTNRVVIDKAITLESANGPATTIIEGRQIPGSLVGDGAIRCVYLVDGAILSGFTIRNGATRATGEYEREREGGGLWCVSTNSVISNCVLIANAADNAGGGSARGTFINCLLASNSCPTWRSEAGGAFSAVFINCTLSGNSARFGGGAASRSILNNCVLTGNSAIEGGGAYLCTLNNCVMISNSVVDATLYYYTYGGAAASSTLNNCIITSNSAANFGGGTSHSFLNNCLVNGNSAGVSGGGVNSSHLNNCTVIGNSAPSRGGAQGGFYINNCIVFSNSASSDPDYAPNISMNYCSATPLPTNGVGNITNAPLFVNQAGGDFRLQPTSPCINAGNNIYMTNSADLDGNLRIVGSTVDIGAYEFQSPGSVLSYVWAQQYGFATDGTADFADNDGDGMNNFGEWRADTIPTNALSLLRMMNVTNGASGLNVTWESVSTRRYSLERATNLSTALPFQLITTNIPGVAGTKTYNDTTATNGGPFFYRVGVQ